MEQANIVDPASVSPTTRRGYISGTYPVSRMPESRTSAGGTQPGTHRSGARGGSQQPNQVKAGSVFIISLTYWCTVVWLYSLTGGSEPLLPAVGLAVVLYLGASMLTAWMLYQRELGRMCTRPHEFERNLPFRSYGKVARSAHHAFAAQAELLPYLQRVVKDKLVQRGLGRNFRMATLKDVDPALTVADSRVICLASAGTSYRGTSITLALYTHSVGKTQSVRWWVLVRNAIDQDRVFRFVALAPLTLPFWIRAYTQKRFDLIDRVRATSRGFFEDIDVDARARAVHEAVLEALEEGLATHQVPVATLRGPHAADLASQEDEVTRQMNRPQTVLHNVTSIFKKISAA